MIDALLFLVEGETAIDLRLNMSVHVDFRFGLRVEVRGESERGWMDGGRLTLGFVASVCLYGQRTRTAGRSRGEQFNHPHNRPR